MGPGPGGTFSIYVNNSYLEGNMEWINLEKRDGIAVISLCREERMNVFNLDSGKELIEVLFDVGSDKSVRCVVITGTGKVFCAGGDISLMEKVIREGGDDMRLLPVNLHAIIAEVRRMEKPVISAINGVAAGAGIGIGLAADLVYASDNAKFVLAYANIGLSPDGGATFLLAREVGYHRAMELMLTGKTLTAKEALELGLINGVFDGEELYGAVYETAKKVAAGPTTAFARAKALFNSAFFEHVETQLERERQALIRQFDTADFREGVSAFLEKRPPRFPGE
jgi:2-(1,2-epoxy-1,2-dihydrophenyl)acetyl-CoA isomerase